jgi:hypothetical protein
METKRVEITVDVKSKVLGNYKVKEVVNSYEELQELKKDYKGRVGVNDFSTSITFSNLSEMGYFEQIV